ncbi:hypothetical protein ZIOFF_012660 [Zingiber officinale]|uniref:General transcription factor 3C polypeptide 3 n=1 Tax=Zingiber officinale TaxID=94328 RepID=A0A8J5HLZ1_ZINOF|nr:hypothetical protein ZIOFF_012660 [Zingiber officinale]
MRKRKHAFCKIVILKISCEQNSTGQLRYFLKKAITADPKDVYPRFELAWFYYELGEYQEAAETYDRICVICTFSTGTFDSMTKTYRMCGMIDQAIRVLEDYVKDHQSICNKNVVNLLIEYYMQNGSHKEALKLIERAYSMCDMESENTLYLKVKEVVCHARLGNMQQTEGLLKGIQTECSDDNGVLISEVADAFLNLRQYHCALKFYLMLEDIPNHANGNIHLKIAECFLSMEERGKAITFYYEGLSRMEDSIDARIILSSILLEEGKVQETINLLSPPQKSKQTPIKNSTQPIPWWESGKIKMQLAKIYHSKGMLEEFVDTIYTCVRETLVIELVNQKGKNFESELSDYFGRFSPLVSILLLFGRIRILQYLKKVLIKREKAHRAKKSLQRRAILKEEKKAAALAAGLDWQSDSEDETLPKVKQEPPLPDFLNEQDHLQFTLHLCKALVSVRRYSEALELINYTLKLEYNTISDEKREEFRSLGAHIAYSTRDPKHGYDYVRYIVQQHPHSVAAWNCYNKVISRFDSHFARHTKFLLHMRVEQKDCVMPMVIHGNQFTMISQHQAAAAEYLEAYKVQPESPLINLCAGTALINLALGFRLQKKHDCIAQGFAFLYNYLDISNDSQEALYNVARAYHHVGLVTLAASYYEKVLAMHVKDYPFPKLPYEDSNLAANKKPGHCNLHREAAYNLHLLYKKSGAKDLARQVLKRYCTL